MNRRKSKGSQKRRTYGTGSKSLRGKIYWIQIHVNGTRHRESTRTQDKDEADRILKRRLAEEASGTLVKVGRVTISDLCDLVVQDNQLHRRRDTNHVIWRSDNCIRPLIGSISAVKFRSEHQEQYIAARRQAGASDSTINRELAIVRRGFHLALRRDPPLLPRAPFIEKLPEGAPREGFLEENQYSKLRNELPAHLKCVFVCAYHLGCRKGELLKIRRDQVDLVAGQIRLSEKQTNGKRPRTLPIYGEMKAWIDMQLAELAQSWPLCPWLFHRRGRRIDPHLRGL
jgi:integrase